VNGVQWHEAASLAELGPTDRKFITQTNDQGITTVTFGDGQHGARPPAGVENITATYRSGIGGPGNLKGGQISLIATRPLGVKAVLNPIEASGGADRETRDQARRNTPVALVALDRLVSVSDYADFARTYAGIAKATAEPPSGGRGQMITVTVAATNDNPIDGSSELLRNLREAFQRLGDPRLPISIMPRERVALVISAKVKIEPDYSWEKLEPIVRAALLDAFGFENIELGEDLFLSDALNVMQALPGVVYVNIDTFDTISEEKLLKGFTSSQAIVLKRTERISIGSSQLAYLSSEVPDTLILQEIKS
jgi:predicted phage baseplate assembly protein